MTSKQYKILFADDDVDFCLAVKEFFNDSIFEVDLVQNGVLALDKAFKNKYDFIILDINMPFMKGSEAARDIKAKLPYVPIIAITGIYQEDNKHKLKAYGFDDVFIKPIQFQTLLEQMEALVGIKASSNETKITETPSIDINPQQKIESDELKITDSIISQNNESESENESVESEDLSTFTFAYLQKLSVSQLIMIIQEQQIEKLNLSTEVKNLKQQLRDLKPF